MATTRRGGFLGIKKGLKSLVQTKKQNKRMYKLSRLRKLKRTKQAAEQSRRKHLQRVAEARANMENAAY
jgi:16S rRNA U1498 N3-methylase RsmE